MKTRILLLSLCMAAIGLNAQVKTPAPSPASTITQTVGLTDITVTYSRPGMKGRTVFGDLVQYDQMWRTGANKNSTISFQHDVKVGGVDVKAGTYAIFTTPNQTMWKVFLYTDTENWGTPENWDASRVAVELGVNPIKLAEKVETMRFSFEDITNSSTNLVLAWEHTAIVIPIETMADAMTMDSIEKTLAGPNANDYYQAARYYRAEGKDVAQALKWINMSVEMGNGEKYWVLREKSLIQAANKDYKGAIETANASKALAEKAGNQDYVRMNNDAIADWTKMLKK